jgi:N-acetylglucosaminyldiphosphoundecaprenol N-acetyl-beta-D-mannosaminyltransferase
LATEALALGSTPAAAAPSLTTQLAAGTPPRRRLDLAGVLIDQVDVTDAVARIGSFAQSTTPHQVVTVNLDFLSLAQRNPHFRETINQADLAVADGMPLVWVSRLTQLPLPERVTGVELVDECCRLAARMGGGVFLLGAAPGVAQTAADRLLARFPGSRVHHYSPAFGPMSEEENERIIDMVRTAAPTFLFVALGAPRQDLWIRDHAERLQVPVAMGVGCVLDLLAGVTRRAPSWMRKSGLEWSYRLAQEPDRLWRRYLMNDVPMLGRLMLAGLVSASPPTAPTSPPHTAV